MRRLLVLLLLGLTLTLLPTGAAQADCGAAGDLDEASVECYLSGDEVRAAYHSSSDYRWWLVQVCKRDAPDGTCFNPKSCVTQAGVPGTLYSVLRALIPDGDPQAYGVACLTAGEAAGLGAITPAMVFAAMRGLSWPSAVLVVQPPGGETLVNLETNFYTTTTGVSVRTVRLLGQRVEIEARPVRYGWHWGGESGDGGSVVTTSPGAAYPDLVVTHVYREAGVRVRPWVDVVYAGRYRVNGGGWRVIPQTLTVAGEPVALDVIEARPVLVG